MQTRIRIAETRDSTTRGVDAAAEHMTSRRDFLRVSGGCLAHVMLSSACASKSTRARWTAPANPTVSTAPFARLDAIAADTWAVISTPLGGDRTTFANGGIIAG